MPFQMVMAFVCCDNKSSLALSMPESVMLEITSIWPRDSFPSLIGARVLFEGWLSLLKYQQDPFHPLTQGWCASSWHVIFCADSEKAITKC